MICSICRERQSMEGFYHFVLTFNIYGEEQNFHFPKGQIAFCRDCFSMLEKIQITKEMPEEVES